AQPAARAALRTALLSSQAGVLRHYRSTGLLSGYSLLFSRYADRDSWDAMEVLHFPSEAALASWRSVERRSPGGLAPAALRLVGSMHSVLTDTVRAAGVHQAQDPSILVIPYLTVVPEDEYLRYLDGYTLPQLRGWVEAGVLDGFQIDFCRFPGGRRWNALLFLDYRDDAALARRAAVVAQVRARLAATDPRWKAYSDDKKSIRSERAITVAERLAGEGPGR
ncbi:MAG: hypothetical protein KGL92_13645, partial [Gammaproteobacteria bacterium]|nr:hypothetical protein [Gammaproteobacteria bacterium]